MTIVGLVHTVATLPPDFHRLIAARRPDVDVIDVVDPTLLARAIERGAGPDVRADLSRHVRHLLDSGARSVLVTCSSVGHLADDLRENERLDVHRVDRAMAEEAVRRASPTGRLTVLATLRSTLEPTASMIRTATAGTDIDIDVVLVEGAARARADGDGHRHDRLIREAVDRVAADVLVLAQASMAGALDEHRPVVPVLTSPESGTERFLAGLAGETGL